MALGGGIDSLDSGSILGVLDGPALGVQLRAMEGHIPGVAAIKSLHAKCSYIESYLLNVNGSVYMFTKQVGFHVSFVLFFFK